MRSCRQACCILVASFREQFTCAMYTQHPAGGARKDCNVRYAMTHTHTTDTRDHAVPKNSGPVTCAEPHALAWLRSAETTVLMRVESDTAQAAVSSRGCRLQSRAMPLGFDSRDDLTHPRLSGFRVWQAAVRASGFPANPTPSAGASCSLGHGHTCARGTTLCDTGGHTPLTSHVTCNVGRN